MQPCLGVHQGPGQGRRQPRSGDAPLSVHAPPGNARPRRLFGGCPGSASQHGKLPAHRERGTALGDFIAAASSWRGYRKDGEGLFTRGCSDRTRGNGSKLKEGRFRLDIGKKFFPRRVVKHWPRLPREAVAAPSLAVFKARLDGALSNLGWWKMSLLMARGWNQMSFKVPPNPNHSMNLWLAWGNSRMGGAGCRARAGCWPKTTPTAVTPEEDLFQTLGHCRRCSAPHQRRGVSRDGRSHELLGARKVPKGDRSVPGK